MTPKQPKPQLINKKQAMQSVNEAITFINHDISQKKKVILL